MHRKFTLGVFTKVRSLVKHLRSICKFIHRCTRVFSERGFISLILDLVPGQVVSYTWPFCCFFFFFVDIAVKASFTLIPSLILLLKSPVGRT